MARKANSLSRVIAFEPNHYLIEQLREACEPVQIEVVEAAVSGTTGTVSFNMDDAQSRILVGSETTVMQHMATVKSIALDDWVQQEGIEPGLIKIDVEGAEGSILRAAQWVLSTYSPAIICEVLHDDAGREVMDALPPDYRYYRIEENGGIYQEEKIWRPRWRDHNWLLQPSQ